MHHTKLRRPGAPPQRDTPTAEPMPGRTTLTQNLPVPTGGHGIQLKLGADIAQTPAPDPGAAMRGVAGASAPLPHRATIQSLFGRHDVSGVRAQVGGPATEACDELGAAAFAVGTQVGFAAPPDLHTAAHEAAHVVQQRAGVSLAGGIGAAGDAYEQHADAVADLVVRGQSAEALLDQHASASGGSQQAVQRVISSSDKLDKVSMLRTGFNLFMQGAVPSSKQLQLLHRHTNFIVYVTASSDVPEGKSAITTYGILDAKGTYAELGGDLNWSYDQMYQRPVKVYATVTLSTREGALLDYANVAQVLAHEICGHAIALGPYVEHLLKKDLELIDGWYELNTRGALSEDGQHALIGYGIEQGYPSAIKAMCQLLEDNGHSGTVKKLKEYFGNDIFAQTLQHGPDKGTEGAKLKALEVSDQAERDVTPTPRDKGSGPKTKGSFQTQDKENVRVKADGQEFELSPDDTKSDGDCLFNSVILLGANQGHNITQLRQLARAGGGRPAITTPGEWAQGQDIEGLCQRLGIRIVVPIYDLSYKVQQTDHYGTTGAIHYIGHIFGGHFVPMRRVG